MKENQVLDLLFTKFPKGSLDHAQNLNVYRFNTGEEVVSGTSIYNIMETILERDRKGYE